MADKRSSQASFLEARWRDPYGLLASGIELWIGHPLDTEKPLIYDPRRRW